MTKKYFQLSKETEQALLSEFCEALLNVTTTKEAVAFLIDLLTRSEAIMLAKRIKIAKLLIEGKDYKTIESLLSVSHGTISKVAAWLREGGEGFRLLAEKASKKKYKPETNWDQVSKEWKSFKRRYPALFWPQLLIEGVIESANKKQREKIRRAVEKLDHKSKIYKQINTALKKVYKL